MVEQHPRSLIQVTLQIVSAPEDESKVEFNAQSESVCDLLFLLLFEKPTSTALVARNFC